jgi:hypothetical protein
VMSSGHAAAARLGNASTGCCRRDVHKQQNLNGEKQRRIVRI